MNNKKYIAVLLCLITAFCSCVNGQNQNNETDADTITFTSSDNIVITSDLYITHEKSAPFIILFHQARSSRGEYLEIAPKLNTLGFNCMAVDQRSGGSMNKVQNETAISAKESGKERNYTDAYPDLEAALLYVKENYDPGRLIVWGSSYSASLVLILVSQYPDLIDAVLSFSPGEYFKYNNKTIAEYASGVECPVFITSAKNEASEWNNIFDAVLSAEKTGFIPEEPGKHGSSTLYESTPGFEEYWQAVEDFLHGLL